MMKKQGWIQILLLTIALCIFSFNVFAKDYDVQKFGAKNDGVTLNTEIIQAAIDYITENGGGRLVFDSGVYLTGTIYLKSNVTLFLKKDSELRSSGNPFDFVKDKYVGWTSMIFAIKQKNIGIVGKGTINGMGFSTANKVVAYIHRGLITDPLSYDRPKVANRPTNIHFLECENIRIVGITLLNPASWNQIYQKCNNVYVDSIHVDANSYWNNDGIDILNCNGVVIRNSYIDAADDILCFKSFDPSGICQNVTVDNCVVRSGANGIKFGTSNKGGFKNFKITNIKVFDTYRSAIALEVVDGGIIDNILIDGVTITNTGNVIFLRMGDRRSDDRTPSFTNVTIKNIHAEVSPIKMSKPDSGYTYEGPIEDLPRNVSPASIIGLPQWRIENVTLSNIEIVYPGGGNPNYAKRRTAAHALESIPESPYDYPDYSMFEELPAWGFYVRHADNITFNNVTLKAKEQGYRPAIVLDDAKNIKIHDVDISEPGKKKEIILNNSTLLK